MNIGLGTLTFYLNGMIFRSVGTTGCRDLSSPPCRRQRNSFLPKSLRTRNGLHGVTCTPYCLKPQEVYSVSGHHFVSAPGLRAADFSPAVLRLSNSSAVSWKSADTDPITEPYLMRVHVTRRVFSD
jgi:hypothetical protein